LNGGLGRALDEEVETSGIREILRVADVTMAKLDSAGCQSAQRQFAASPFQVVKGNDCAVGLLTLER
jgi:hypothetical protein